MQFKSIGRVLPLFFFLFSQQVFAKKIRLLPERIDYTLCSQNYEEKLSEQDSVAKALFNRKDLEAYEYIRRQAKTQERSALSAYIPQANFGLKKAYVVPTQLLHPETAEPRRCPDETSLTDVTYGATQLIFSGGKPLLDYRIAKEGTRIVELDEQTAANNIRFSTESAFLESQRLHWKNNLIEIQDRTAKINFSLNSCSNMVGFLNQADWQSAIATYGSTQSNVFNYQRDKVRAFDTLQREMSIPICAKDFDFSLDNVEDIFLEPVQQYMRAAMRYRPELEKTKRAAKQAKWQERRYSRNYIPDVKIYAEAFDNQLKVWGPRYRLSRWAAGLKLDWTFDGLLSVHSAEQSKNLEIQYRLQEKDLELKIETDVKRTHEQIKILQNKIKAQILLFKQQKTNLAFKQDQFKVGNISKAELANAQQSYKQAEFDLVSLQIDIKLQYQNLLFICGYPKKIGSGHRVVT